MTGDLSRRLHEAHSRATRAGKAVAQQITQATDVPPWEYKVAIVTGTSPLEISYSDGVPIQAVSRLASYTPVALDTVLVLARAPVATILGKLVP